MDCSHRWTTAEFLVGQGPVKVGVVHEFIDALGRNSAKEMIAKNQEKFTETINRAIEILKEATI